jgi:hypothetical protein
MFHKFYVVVCVARDFQSNEIESHVTTLNHKDIAEDLVKAHKANFGQRIIYCDLTQEEIWVG